MTIKKSFTIHDLPFFDRPRERLKELGPESLSVQELLAVILGRGIKGESVWLTAQRLLQTFGSVAGIASASLEELGRVKGIGPAKASQLKAVFALADRIPSSGQPGYPLKKTQNVVSLVVPRLKNKKKEIFMIICLDTQQRLIRMCDISVGTLESSLVHPREVFKEAIQACSSAIILVHNHPSGTPEPSADDIKVTIQLVKAAKLMDIPILDHIIVAGESYLSFKEEGIVF